MRTRRKIRRRVRRTRVRRNPPKMTAARKAKIAAKIRALHKSGLYKKTRSVVRRTTTSVARRPGRLRRAYAAVRSRFRGGGGRFPITVKGLMSKSTLTFAGGAIGSGLLTSFVMQRWGAMLPMGYSPIGSIAYRLAIPFAGAYALRNTNRQLAEGMLIGGVILALNEAIRQYMPGGLSSIAPVQGTSAYLGAPATPAVPIPGYSAVDAFGSSIYNSESAFKTSAWD